MNEHYYDGPSGMEPVVDERPMEDVRPESTIYPKQRDYKPKRQDILREYEIGIKFLSVGCIINVGCKQIPFRSIDEAMEELNKYVKNPYEEGKKWRDIFDGEN